MKHRRNAQLISSSGFQCPSFPKPLSLTAASNVFPRPAESWEKAFHAALFRNQYTATKILQKFYLQIPLHELFRAGVKEWLDETLNLRGYRERRRRKPSSVGKAFKQGLPESENTNLIPGLHLWLASRTESTTFPASKTAALQSGLKSKNLVFETRRATFAK